MYSSKSGRIAGPEGGGSEIIENFIPFENVREPFEGYWDWIRVLRMREKQLNSGGSGGGNGGGFIDEEDSGHTCRGEGHDCVCERKPSELPSDVPSTAPVQVERLEAMDTPKKTNALHSFKLFFQKPEVSKFAFQLSTTAMFTGILCLASITPTPLLIALFVLALVAFLASSVNLYYAHQAQASW